MVTPPTHTKRTQFNYPHLHPSHLARKVTGQLLLYLVKHPKLTFGGHQNHHHTPPKKIQSLRNFQYFFIPTVYKYGRKK